MSRTSIRKRQKDILEVIITSQDPIKSCDLAKKFNVSLRTIQNDISYIRYYLKEFNVKLISKPGIGFWINKNKVNIKKVLQSLYEDKDHSEKDEREKYIICKFLNNNGEKFTIEYFAQKLYISNATVYRSLNIIESWFLKYNLKLCRKKGVGIKVIGQEKDIRYAMTANILRCITYCDLVNFSKGKNSFIDKICNAAKFLDNVNVQDIRKIIFIINSSCNVWENLCINPSYYNILLNIIVSFDRIRKGKHIVLEKTKNSDLRNKKEYKLAVCIANNIEKKFNVKYTQEEIYFLELTFIGNRIDCYNNMPVKQIYKQEIRNYNTQEIVRDIAYYIEKGFNIELVNNKRFLLALKLHLNSIINGSKCGAKIMNPFLNEIKLNYPYAFNVALEIIDRLNEKYNIEMDENNAGYIALHVQAGIEESTFNRARIINTYLVCNSGLGLVHLLSIQIKKKFFEVNIVKMTSQNKLKKELSQSLKKELPELIISTVPISLSNFCIPLVKVNPILTENDIKQIDSKIKQIIENKNNENKDSNKNVLKTYMHKNIIYNDLTIDNREKLIKYVCEDMYLKGYVTSQFEKSVIEREKLSSTYVTNGVAVPHGNAKYVLKPAIAMITLTNPVVWDGFKVNSIFLCALDLSVDKVSERLFEELYSIIEDKKLLKKLQRITD